MVSPHNVSCICKFKQNHILYQRSCPRLVSVSYCIGISRPVPCHNISSLKIPFMYLFVLALSMGVMNMYVCNCHVLWNCVGISSNVAYGIYPSVKDQLVYFGCAIMDVFSTRIQEFKIQNKNCWETCKQSKTTPIRGKLNHLPLDKMAAVSQTIFPDVFSCMKFFLFWLKLKFVP